MEICMRCGKRLSFEVGILVDLDKNAFTLCDRCAGEQILRKGGCLARLHNIEESARGGAPGGQYNTRTKEINCEKRIKGELRRRKVEAMITYTMMHKIDDYRKRNDMPTISTAVYELLEKGLESEISEL